MAAVASKATAPQPSDNFYMHVNQQWLNAPENAIPGEYSSWGGFTKLHDVGLKNQIQLVKDLGEKASRTEEEEKIYAIWKASSDRFASWGRGESTYEPLVKELGALETFFGSSGTFEGETDYLDKLANYLHYTQVSGIRNVIDFDKGSDLKNVNNVVLDFSTSGLSLPSREYYFQENFEEKRTPFRGHLENVKALVEANVPNANLGDRFVDNVIEFETEIAKFGMKREQSREYDRYYTNTTLQGMYEDIDSLRSLDEKQENYEEADRNFQLGDAAKANIAIFMEKMYELFGFRDILAKNRDKHFASDDAKAPNREAITAYDGDAIRRILNVIIDPSKFDKYRSYMQYKIVAKFFSFCSKALDDEFFDFFQRKLGGQAEQKPEEKRSINIVNAYAGEMMGKVFVGKYFPPESKANVRALIDETLAIMKSSLESNDWLTKATKEKALAKLARFRTKIGFPDEWKDYSDFDATMGDSLYDIAKKAKRWALRVEFYEKLNSVLDREEWRMTPQTVNAYFMPTQNEIVFPAAILQPPFYHKDSSTIDFDTTEENALVEGADVDMTTAANFGGIVAVIAHEITHGYDDKGRKFDGDGNLNDWWTEEDGALFKLKTDIMAKSAERYKFVDVESEEKKEYEMNPQLTMGENLADLGGLSLSLQALLKRLKEQGASDKVRKASLRILFKSWANVWKQNIKKDRRIQLLTLDPHAPTDFRGNLVQHMSEFYESFDIKDGDAMWIPESERVRMW